jgi:ribosomal protein S27AE
MTPNSSPSRALQQDARAWSAFTGTKYTAALRQMSSPLAQGLLGPRVSARRLIAALSDHELIGAHGGAPLFGENGVRSDLPWRFNGKTDYIQLALITDTLRMFTPISDTSTPEIGSYSLKHTAEWFLSPHCSYVSNGRLIWAAAAMGLPIADPDGDGPNLLVGVSEREHDYVRRMVGSGQTRPQADHYRPAGYERLRSALAQAAAGEFITDGWVRPVPVDEPAPFHHWLIRQIGRNDVVGDLAGDYSAGVRGSDHRIARTADELLAIFHEVSHSPEAYDAVVTSIAEWMRTEPSSTPIRTERVGGDSHDHGGWGAGAGTVERHEYLCPCGNGTILEEHDNIPGFREHDVRIDCDKCRAEWRFLTGRGVRDWALEPMPGT